MIGRLFRPGRERRPLDAIEEIGLDRWLDGLQMKAAKKVYNLYRGAPVSETPLTACVVGLAPSEGPSAYRGKDGMLGFCAEMYQGRVTEAILFEPRFAARDKTLSLHSIATGVRIIDLYRRIAPCENWTAWDGFGTVDTEPAPTPGGDGRKVAMESAWSAAALQAVVNRYSAGEVEASAAALQIASAYHSHVMAQLELFDEGEFTVAELLHALQGVPQA